MEQEEEREHPDEKKMNESGRKRRNNLAEGSMRANRL